VAIEFMCRKIGMTQLFNEAGECVPVTVLDAQPNRVVPIELLVGIGQVDEGEARDSAVPANRAVVRAEEAGAAASPSTRANWRRRTSSSGASRSTKPTAPAAMPPIFAVGQRAQTCCGRESPSPTNTASWSGKRSGSTALRSHW